MTGRSAQRTGCLGAGVAEADYRAALRLGDQAPALTYRDGGYDA